MPHTPGGVYYGGMSPEERSKLIGRLKRAEGQLGAVRRMLEAEDYCVDVLLQLSAVRGALGRIGEMVLSSHIETCVSEAFQHGDGERRQRMIDELMEVFSRYGGIGAR